MRVLVLDEASRQTIRTLKEFAEANPIGLAEMTAMRDGQQAPVGDNPAHVCQVPHGFCCVFSVEQHPGALVRHLSVSVDGQLYPHEAAIAELMREFGFRAQHPQAAPFLYLEEDVRAVNVLESLTPVAESQS